MCHQKSARLAMGTKFTEAINRFDNEWLRQENNFGKDGTCGYF